MFNCIFSIAETSFSNVWTWSVLALTKRRHAAHHDFTEIPEQATLIRNQFRSSTGSTPQLRSLEQNSCDSVVIWYKKPLTTATFNPRHVNTYSRRSVRFSPFDIESMLNISLKIHCPYRFMLGFFLKEIFVYLFLFYCIVTIGSYLYFNASH